MSKKANILECTLRDGSYPIEYQFTAEDTAIIATALENAGFNLIEIGHGLGLDASSAGEGVAAATDEEYIKAASSALKKAKFGTFFIPGIGKEKSLKMAAEYGMDFVRIGTNAPEVKKAEKYIKLAKKLGMIVSSNLMKSYALKPQELVECAKMVEEWGADIAYVVDSAGGMLPEEVREYVKQIKDKVDISIGFHGHNNFSLAVANTLVAIESGATFVDCTLQGIGRSAGNAPTEILLLTLEKLGYKTGIDPFKVMDISETFIKPMMKESGISSIDVTEGYALFHSKFLKNIYKVARKFDLDPRKLIIKASEKSLLYVPEELVMTVAKDILKKKRTKFSETKIVRKIPLRIDDISPKSLPISDVARDIAKKLSSMSKKSGKKSVFTIAVSRRKAPIVSPFVRESELYVIGNSEISCEADLVSIVKEIDGVVDLILVDDEKKNENLKDLYETARQIAKKSSVYNYKDEDLWSRIADITISQLRKNLVNKKITIFGCESLGNKLALNLAERGAKIVLCDYDVDRLKVIVNGLNLIKSSHAPEITATSDKTKAAEDAEILIGVARNKPLITREMVQRMRKDGFIFDAGVGTILASAMDYASKRGIETYRIDMKAGLSGEILSILETSYLINSILGRTKMRGVSVIAGGILGRKGEIVVDSISNPTTILGVADGRGGFIRDITPYLEDIKKVKYEIIRRKMLKSYRKGKHN